jgi:phage terminase Nu1 subunit (DNA packaging protein)
MKPSTDIERAVREAFPKVQLLFVKQLLDRVKLGEPLTDQEWHQLERAKEYLFFRDHPNVVGTQEDVSRAFGVAARSVKRWSQSGMPKRDDGRYDIVDIAVWKYKRERVPGQGEPAAAQVGEAAQADIEYRKLRTLKEKAEYERLIGTVVERSEVARVIGAKVTSVKNALLSIPRKLTPRLLGADARAISAVLDEEIRAALRAFAGGDALIGVDASEPKPKRRRTGKKGK